MMASETLTEQQVDLIYSQHIPIELPVTEEDMELESAVQTIKELELQIKELKQRCETLKMISKEKKEKIQADQLELLKFSGWQSIKKTKERLSELTEDQLKYLIFKQFGVSKYIQITVPVRYRYGDGAIYYYRKTPEYAKDEMILVLTKGYAYWEKCQPKYYPR